MSVILGPTMIVYPARTGMWKRWERSSTTMYCKHSEITFRGVKINFKVELNSKISLTCNSTFYPFSVPFSEMQSLPAKPA